MNPESIQDILNRLHETYQSLHEGTVASYIPELARANPDWFAIALVTTQGEIYTVGDVQQPFTIQSMSKPFTYGIALEDYGREEVLEHIGVEPTGKTFNAIVLDEKTGRPSNPMVNAGAIAIADLIKGTDLTDKLRRMLTVFKSYAGHDIHLDATTFTSERLTGHTNRAIAYLMRASGVLKGDIDAALDFYFQQCSLLVTCQDLATMAATFANGGVNPVTGEQAVQATYVRDILSVMYTCGMYDTSGEWAYRVGLPGKSGVSGGIFAVVPGRLGIAVFSPPLNEHSHSVRGLKVIESLSQELGLHIFHCDAT